MFKFGIVGTNFITDWLLDGAKHEKRFQLSAVYSRTEERAREFAGKYGIGLVFTDLAEMARSPEIDAVYIASPNALHAAQAILFLNHGKHVLCEKAFASNAGEVRQMVRAAQESGCVLMEAMKTTLLPNSRLAGGTLPALGKIRRYSASFCQYSSRYDRFKEGVVLNAFRPEFSNGALMDIGVYCIYPMVVWFGRPLSVSAAGVMLPSGVDGAGEVVFRYPEMVAGISYSKITDSSRVSEIQGEDGNLTISRINAFDRIQLRLRGGEETELTVPALAEDMYYELKEFIDLIEQGKQESALNSWDNSLAVMEIMDEIRRQIGVVYPAG